MLSNRTDLIKKYQSTLVLILILFFATLVRCYEITLPYCKTWEIAFQEIIAKNHFIYGFAQTHFVSVISVINGQNIYHLSHPPLLQIVIAISYFFFGIHEWSARIIPILFSLGTIILIFAIADRTWDRRAALFSAFITSFIPMSAYFGRIVNFEPAVLFFILLFAWAYLIWDETSSNNYLFIAVAAVVLGGMTDWPFFLVLPFFVLISLITRKKIGITVLLFFLGCGVAAGYLFLKNSIVGYKSGVSDWFSHLLFRSNIPAFIGNPDLYSRIITRIWLNFSLAIILAAIGVFLSIYIFRKKQITCQDLTTKRLIPPALLLFGFSYLFIFLESTFTHEWQMYYLIPGISLYAGYTLSSLYSFTLKGRLISILVKMGSIVLLILFISLSVQSLISFHEGKSYEAYYFGSRINEWTKPGDYICVIGLLYPIPYYADRQLTQNPVDDIPDLARIQELNPKVVAFVPNETQQSPWNRQDLRNVLKENNYTLLTMKPQFEMWVRDVAVPDILVRDIDSIEVRDPRTGNVIPQADDRGDVPPPQVLFRQELLYEHPLSNGIIRTNYHLDIPEGSHLTFGIGLDERVWDPSMGDGVTYEVYCQAGDNETRLFSQYIDPKNNVAVRKWLYYSVPLDTCSGNDTRISFATSAGPENNNSYDWAYWMNPRIERDVT